MDPSPVRLLGPADVRRLAEALAIRPSKARGQNFVHDANTVRRIARLAEVGVSDVVLEVGPGLGSLTLALLQTGAHVVAVEVDAALARALPATLADRAGEAAAACDVVHADALEISSLPRTPTALVANLPYNVAVPVLLTLLQRFESIQRALVMVQAEVADRLAAGPANSAYGAPSVKAAWYGHARRVGTVPRTVFWPVPNVESALVLLVRHDVAAADSALRDDVFSCVDAAFGQRRKTLRSSLAGWAGGRQNVAPICAVAGVDPAARGEELALEDFLALARARTRGPGEPAADAPDMGPPQAGFPPRQ